MHKHEYISYHKDSINNIHNKDHWALALEAAFKSLKQLAETSQIFEKKTVSDQKSQQGLTLKYLNESKRAYYIYIYYMQCVHIIAPNKIIKKRNNFKKNHQPKMIFHFGIVAPTRRF